MSNQPCTNITRVFPQTRYLFNYLFNLYKKQFCNNLLSSINSFRSTRIDSTMQQCHWSGTSFTQLNHMIVTVATIATCIPPKNCLEAPENTVSGVPDVVFGFLVLFGFFVLLGFLVLLVGFLVLLGCLVLDVKLRT